MSSRLADDPCLAVAGPAGRGAGRSFRCPDGRMSPPPGRRARLVLPRPLCAGDLAVAGFGMLGRSLGPRTAGLGGRVPPRNVRSSHVKFGHPRADLVALAFRGRLVSDPVTTRLRFFPGAASGRIERENLAAGYGRCPPRRVIDHRRRGGPVSSSNSQLEPRSVTKPFSVDSLW